MHLNDISLYLDVDEYSDSTSEFQFRSRYLCNYVRRRIAPLRIQTEGFGSIAVRGCREPRNGCSIEGDKVAIATVKFDKQRYDSLPPADCHEFFIAMLLEGLGKCARQFSIPMAELQSSIDDFRAGGYRNEWTFKRQTLRAAGLQVALNCSLDMEKFTLALKLERNGGVVYDEPILETKPDELIFAHKFKDVVIEGHTLVVTNRVGKPTFSLALDSLP